jgi:hypothetical protein
MTPTPERAEHPGRQQLDDRNSDDHCHSSCNNPLSENDLVLPSSSPGHRTDDADGSSTTDTQFALSETLVLNGVSYSLAEIRFQKGQLDLARINREFPATAIEESAVNIIQDYNLLMQLRAARGDPASVPSAVYTRLRVEISRKIRERDDEFEIELEKKKMEVRVHRLLEKVSAEDNRHQQSTHACPKKAVNEKTLDFDDPLIEKVFGVIERAVLDATGPLRLNIGRIASQLDILDRHIADIAELHSLHAELVQHQIVEFEKSKAEFDSVFNNNMLIIKPAQPNRAIRVDRLAQAATSDSPDGMNKTELEKDNEPQASTSAVASNLQPNTDVYQHKHKCKSNLIAF